MLDCFIYTSPNMAELNIRIYIWLITVTILKFAIIACSYMPPSLHRPLSVFIHGLKLPCGGSPSVVGGLVSSYCTSVVCVRERGMLPSSVPLLILDLIVAFVLASSDRSLEAD